MLAKELGINTIEYPENRIPLRFHHVIDKVGKGTRGSRQLAIVFAKHNRGRIE